MTQLTKRSKARRTLSGFTLSLLALASTSGCGSGYHTVAGSTTTPPSTTVITTAQIYSIDATFNTVLHYAPDGKGSVTLASTLTLPVGLTALLVATDPTGQVYVGGYTTNVNTIEVLVYAPSATGITAPSRTIQLATGKLTALTVDSIGQIYAGQLNTLGAVNIYAANASGVATPIRVIDPPELRYINDIAVDTVGNTYVSAYNGGVYIIEAYPPTASGAATPARVLTAPANSYFGGISVDDNGTLYALEQLTIIQLSPTASGTPFPTVSINVPGPVAPYTLEAFSNVLRRDTAGNFYVPVAMSNSTASANYVFGFAANASGNATPILSFTATDATLSAPLGVNVALAVH